MSFRARRGLPAKGGPVEESRRAAVRRRRRAAAVYCHSERGAAESRNLALLPWPLAVPVWLVACGLQPVACNLPLSFRARRSRAESNGSRRGRGAVHERPSRRDLSARRRTASTPTTPGTPAPWTSSGCAACAMGRNTRACAWNARRRNAEGERRSEQPTADGRFGVGCPRTALPCPLSLDGRGKVDGGQGPAEIGNRNNTQRL